MPASGDEADNFVICSGEGVDPQQVKLFEPEIAGPPSLHITVHESPMFGVPQTGPFFGRGADLASLIAKLGDHRFVPVVGTGGIGKSTPAAAARWFSRHHLNYLYCETRRSIPI